MNNHRISIPIVISHRRCKILCDHVMIDVVVCNGGIVEYRGIGYFPPSVWDEVEKEIAEKIIQCGQANTNKDRDYINFFKHFTK
jgi:hypothetical protein